MKTVITLFSRNSSNTIKSVLYFTLIILLSQNITVGQDIPEFQSELLSSIQPIREKLYLYDGLLNKGKEHSIDNNTESPLGELGLNSKELKRIFSDLDKLREIQLYYRNTGNIKLDLVKQSKFDVIDNTFHNLYSKRYNEYNSTSIDRSFSDKNHFTPGKVIQNGSGIYVYAEILGQDTFGEIQMNVYHSLSNSSLWTPLGRTGEVLIDFIADPMWVESQLCGDAYTIYDTEWENYLRTKKKKEQRKQYVSQLINEKLMIKIDHLYDIKRDSTIAGMVYTTKLKKKTQSKLPNLVKQVRTSGVVISKDKESNVTFIYNTVKSFGENLQKLYQSYLSRKENKRYVEASYYLFNLIATDVARTHQDGYKEFLQFKENHKSDILKGIDFGFVEGGRFSGFSKVPLTNYECTILAGLAGEDILSMFSHREDNRDQLPRVNPTQEQLSNMIEITGNKIITIDEIMPITQVDANTIKNIYLAQPTQFKKETMTTDNYNIIGLLSGSNLVLMDSKGKPSVHEVKIEETESWGIKSYSIQFVPKENLSSDDYLNIRIKKSPD